MTDLTTPGTAGNQAHIARLLGVLGQMTREAAVEDDEELNFPPRLEKLFEQIREAVGADLTCLLETPSETDSENAVDVKLAAGYAADRVFGLHSSLIKSENAELIPEAFTKMGLTNSRFLPLSAHSGSSKDWLGIFWSGTSRLAEDIEEFLSSAAQLVKKELQLQASAETRKHLLKKLDQETRALAELRASVERQVKGEQLFRIIGETIPFGVWVADMSGHPSYVSQSFLDLVGTTLEEYRQFKWLDRVNVEDRAQLGPQFRAAVENGLPLSVEMRITGVDEREYTILLKGAPFYDESGTRIGYAGIQLDITDRRLAETDLRRSEEQYKQIVDVATEGIWKTDSNKQTTFTNRSLSNLLGYSTEELSHIKIQDLIAPECLPAFHSGWNAARAGLRNQFDCSFKCKNNESVWALVSLSPMFDAYDRFSGALILLTDVTERHEAESQLKQAKIEAEEANQAKSKFLANMSHEIRTPLSSVLGFAELLLDEDQTEEERRESVHAIRRNGHLLLSLINDILDLSKVEAGRMDVEPVVFSLAELLDELPSIFKPQAMSKGISLDVLAHPDLPKEICTDPTRFRQILFNLVSNALKFTDQGNVTVRFEKQKHDLVVEIEDTGPGISKTDAAKLFSPFTQADASITRRFGGTGLGLVLSQNLARALGGDVRLVKSEVGRGSLFEIRIVFDLLPGESRSHRKARTHQANCDEINLENMQILLVDDSPDNRLLVRRMLEPLGVNLELAENGLRGFEMAFTKNFDLIFMDMQMPVMDGYQATERLRKAGFDKPIVALTAQAMKEERQRAFDVGCTSHLSKPLTKQSLLDTIADCLRK